jgi:hypothetical protein
LLTVDGVLVADRRALKARVRAKRIGDRVTLVVIHDASPLHLAIAVGDLIEWGPRRQHLALRCETLLELAGHATVLVIAPRDHNEGCDTCEPAWK